MVEVKRTIDDSLDLLDRFFRARDKVVEDAGLDRMKDIARVDFVLSFIGCLSNYVDQEIWISCIETATRLSGRRSS